MKIVVDFNDLTNLIITDLANKGIQVSADDIEYNENGAEIVLNPVAVKPTKPKRDKKAETKVEVEPVTEVTDELVENEPELTEEPVESNADEDDALFG